MSEASQSEQSVVGHHEYSDIYDGKQKRFCQAPTTRNDRYDIELLVYQIFSIQLPSTENHRSWNSASEDCNNGQKISNIGQPFVRVKAVENSNINPA